MSEVISYKLSPEEHEAFKKRVGTWGDMKRYALAKFNTQFEGSSETRKSSRNTKITAEQLQRELSAGKTKEEIAVKYGMKLISVEQRIAKLGRG